ncbi:S-layer homology domain-containing protein [Oceanobacillus massiliensis]|uniref:S-layer homology domain-containing protein n=1 Tax=Oceanobacillus massiliensis TaxID=1465765 RepID=UPI0030171D77
MRKNSLCSALMIVCSLFFFSISVHAEGSNPPLAEMKETITATALEYDIPPEILKAIAYVETGYKQFDEDGNPIISPDGGIGMMQVTPNNIDVPNVDEELLANDIEYNITIAAQVLNDKWNLAFIPKVNDGDRHSLEDWYFAVMAYNGLAKDNDPNLYPGSAYQERIYNRIAGSSLIYWSADYFEFPVFDIRYEDGDETMKFPEGVDYTTETVTPTQQMYQSGEITYLDPRDGAVNLYVGSISGNERVQMLPYTPLRVTGERDESPKMDNDFIYYHVNSVTTDGYISSAYLNEGSEDIVFSDPIEDERAAALAYLSMNNYVNGYLDGSFGSGDKLKREHVAVILDRILDMEMPSGYELKADDVDSDHRYYEEIAKAEYNGYLGVGGKIRPTEYLTRAQMASVMVRAFNDYYNEPTTEHTFEDQDSIWTYETINKIYYNEVTIADPFRPSEDITRSQFALFLYRTLVEY